MSESQPAISRPVGVTLLMVLGVIFGIVTAASGLLLILDRNDTGLHEDAGFTSNQVVSTGITFMVIGVVYVILALMLGKGSSLVRWLYGIVTLFNLAWGVWGLIALHGEQQQSSALSVVFGAMVLWILFGTQRADDFFKAA